MYSAFPNLSFFLTTLECVPMSNRYLLRPYLSKTCYQIANHFSVAVYDYRYNLFYIEKNSLYFKIRTSLKLSQSISRNRVILLSNLNYSDYQVQIIHSL